MVNRESRRKNFRRTMSLSRRSIPSNRMEIEPPRHGQLTGIEGRAVFRKRVRLRVARFYNSCHSLSFPSWRVRGFIHFALQDAFRDRRSADHGGRCEIETSRKNSRVKATSYRPRCARHSPAASTTSPARGRGHLDAAVAPIIRRLRRPSPGSCIGLQSPQFRALPGDAKTADWSLTS
jgi:hypothetical protein